ncbi:uncharacterized protein LOC121383864 [Gigantopelta aegis]|uniref:uncharacterized protein LOC121383864 n=1 Tax=Gigantopelta aegis TaxID=1735272 RepID=UPI001B8876B9|nr:uncharacterized protein LOC121383864 [Gigantopelta aegis]
MCETPRPASPVPTPPRSTPSRPPPTGNSVETNKEVGVAKRKAATPPSDQPAKARPSASGRGRDFATWSLAVMDYFKMLLLGMFLFVQLTENTGLSPTQIKYYDVNLNVDNCAVPVDKGPAICRHPSETPGMSLTQSDGYLLSEYSECVVDNACFTCVRGSWVTSQCQHDYDYRQKRFFWFVAGVVACLMFCGGGGGGGGGNEYKPPKFTKCAGPESVIYTPKGKRAAIVTWTTPTYESGSAGEPTLSLASTSGSSGNDFSVSHYTIVYELVDQKAFTKTCSFSFEVKVRSCPWPYQPNNGQINCGRYDVIYGDTCRLSCDTGYQPSGYTVATCQSNENYDVSLASCQPKQCPLLSIPDNGKDYQCSDGNNYNSRCVLSCKPGFTRSPMLTVCEVNQNWMLPLPECTDTLRPEFNNCPSASIQAYADRGKTTAVVTWNPPTATDNSGTVTVQQVDGLRPNQTFSEGSSTIKYTATDPSGNTAHCAFAVNVVTLTCDYPDFGDSNLHFDCTHGYRYGSQCSVSCKAGLPLNGTNTIVCEKDNSIPPVTYWDLGGEIRPHCIKRPCQDLKRPKNGALACDTSVSSFYCSMSCQENWDIPRLAKPVDLYICGWSTGRWAPTSDIPDCTEKFTAGKMRLSSELYYYSGSCGDNSTLDEIKGNFVNIMNDKGIWVVSCSTCTVDNVVVFCGEGQSRRKRRSTDTHTEMKRSAETQTVISWDWVVPIDGDTVSAITTADGFLMALADRMNNFVQNNDSAISLTGLELRSNSYGYDESHLVCPLGYSENWARGTCSPCPTGTMYDKTNDVCSSCPTGFYQDEAGQFECKTCPTGTTTVITGARTRDNCTEVCSAGHFSSNGVVPCDGCPIGQYQPNSGSKNCLSCDYGTTTTNTATTDPDACQEFDIRVEGPALVSSTVSLQNSTDDFTIALWFATGAEANLRIKQSDESYPFQRLNVLGNNITDVVLPSSSWAHVSIVFAYTDKLVTVYNNGEVSLSKTLASVPTPAVDSGSRLEIIAQADAVMTMRSLFLLPTALSASDVRTLASSCGSKPSDFALSLIDLSGGDSPRSVRVIIPSTCDAVDECQQNSPCNGHTCINLPGSYRCECQDGFSGSDCSVPPDFCADNKCEQGTCENRTKDYVCNCYDGFKGQLCEVKIVNGEWNNWSDWDVCSLTCGYGTQTRRRRCDNPAPTQPEGKNCSGSGSQTRACNTVDCPVCRSTAVRNGLGSRAQCNGTESSLDCVSVCRNPNHVVDPFDKQVVRCRDGIWDAERPKVASCTKINAPSVATVTTTATYQTDSCLSQTSLSGIESSVHQNTATLACSSHSSCQTNVQAVGCGDSYRGRRSILTTVVINITINIIEGDLQLGDFLATQTISQPLQSLINAINILEMSAKQIQNDTSIFLARVNGVEYSVLKESVTTATGLHCPTGTAARDIYCVYCAPGAYSQGDECKFCEVGSYQDEIGQTECKRCPPGKSTQFIGSTDVEDCTESADNNHETTDDKRNSIWKVVGGALGAMAAAGLLVAIVYKIYRSHMTKKAGPRKDRGRPASQASTSKVLPEVVPGYSMGPYDHYYMGEQPPAYTERCPTPIYNTWTTGN